MLHAYIYPVLPTKVIERTGSKVKLKRRDQSHCLPERRGNDVGCLDSEELLRRFRAALAKVRNRNRVPVVCGVLPRRAVGDMSQSRAITLNCRLAEHCETNRWIFVDN